MFVVTRRADETTQLLIVKKKISSCFVFFVFSLDLIFIMFAIMMIMSES